MKTSNKIILTAAMMVPLSICLLLLAVTNGNRGASPMAEANASDPGPSTSKTYHLSDFSEIIARGAWDIRLSRGNEFQVEITAPKTVLENLTVSQEEEKLSLLNQAQAIRVAEIDTPEIDIVLPSLSGVDMQGVTRLSLSGFINTSLRIVYNGLVDLTGEGCTVTDLTLAGNGVSTLDMSKFAIANADVILSGVYQVELSMTGGRLKGSLNGTGKLITYGNIAENEIKKISPLNKVIHD